MRGAKHYLTDTVGNTTETESETFRGPERWANSDPNTDFPDYSLQVSFPDSGDEQDGEATTTGTKLFPVSQKTEDFLSSCFTTVLPNEDRRQWKGKYRVPRTAVTAGLNMDKVLMSRLSIQTKAKDKLLAMIQALLLNAVAPQSFILEEASKGQLPRHLYACWVMPRLTSAGKEGEQP